jgi:diphthine synthase
MIGIGLNDEKDITVKGFEAVKKSDFVYLESYTSRLQRSVSDLEKFYGKKIILADRNLVENNADEIIDRAKTKDAAFLIIGDVFSATTHADLFLRAKNKKVKVVVISNASILNAIGITGLELYKFGKTTSLPYHEKSFEPETAYDVIKDNLKQGLHTLVLLDIKADEDRFMTVNEAIELLLKIEIKRKEGIFTRDTKVIGCARIGGDYKIKYNKAENLLKENFGKPLHCLIVPGKLHFIEEEFLDLYK